MIHNYPFERAQRCFLLVIFVLCILISCGYQLDVFKMKSVQTGILLLSISLLWFHGMYISSLVLIVFYLIIKAEYKDTIEQYNDTNIDETMPSAYSSNKDKLLQIFSNEV